MKEIYCLCGIYDYILPSLKFIIVCLAYLHCGQSNAKIFQVADLMLNMTHLIIISNEISPDLIRLNQNSSLIFVRGRYNLYLLKKNLGNSLRQRFTLIQLGSFSKNYTDQIVNDLKQHWDLNTKV